MKTNNGIKPLFLVVAVLCFVESPFIIPVQGKIAFAYFGGVCLAGMVFRWGATVPVTLLAFFFGQGLPYKNEYAHHGIESVEHDLINPTIVATAVAVLMIISDWLSAKRKKPEDVQLTEHNR